MPVSTARISTLDERGFVMPTVLFVLVVMSVLAVASLRISDDEQRSGRALRESGRALYSAEAGANWLRSNSSVLDSLVGTLSPGDSADVGWRTLADGSRVRMILHRFDNGGQAMYRLSVTGQGADLAGGRHEVDVWLTEADPIPITAALKGGSTGQEADVRDFATLSGRDTIPAAWNSVCANPTKDVPGLEWGNTIIDDDDGDGRIEGDPPIQVDPSLAGTDLFDWGEMDLADLIALKDITIPVDDYAGGIGPSYTGGACRTSDVWNWGQPFDPSSPCFDYFPIIYWDGGGNDEFRIRDHAPGDAYGQGILIVDGHLRIEDHFTFFGVMLVTGEIRFEAQDGANNHIFGGIIAGHKVRLEDFSKRMQYSQCAVRRALRSISRIKVVDRRAWSEPLR